MPTKKCLTYFSWFFIPVIGLTRFRQQLYAATPGMIKKAQEYKRAAEAKNTFVWPKGGHKSWTRARKKNGGALKYTVDKKRKKIVVWKANIKCECFCFLTICDVTYSNCFSKIFWNTLRHEHKICARISPLNWKITKGKNISNII